MVDQVYTKMLEYRNLTRYYTRKTISVSFIDVYKRQLDNPGIIQSQSRSVNVLPVGIVPHAEYLGIVRVVGHKLPANPISYISLF